MKELKSKWQSTLMKEAYKIRLIIFLVQTKMRLPIITIRSKVKTILVDSWTTYLDGDMIDKKDFNFKKTLIMFSKLL